jgi:LmbE family N-acetylglucosaminyl deacetylase
MMSLFDPSRVQRVLCLGAHSDDIEIGVGGTILRLIEQNPQIEFRWVVFGGNEQRQQEARHSAEEWLNDVKSKVIDTHSYRDAFFPSQLEQIKETFEAIKKSFVPDLIFTHYRDDLHQDHRVINQLTWNTFRSHAVLEYEIVKFDGDLGHPNVFVPLSSAIVEKKTNLLLQHFASQRGKQWYDEETFRGYMRIRGIECNSPTKYAEAFHGRKIVL